MVPEERFIEGLFAPFGGLSWDAAKPPQDLGFFAKLFNISYSQSDYALCGPSK